MEEAVQCALDQITEKNYDADLLEQGISAERIRHYGFAFEGKKVLIGQGKQERCLRKRSKGRWDSLLLDWGQIIAIENCSVYSNPLSII